MQAMLLFSIWHIHYVQAPRQQAEPDIGEAAPLHNTTALRNLPGFGAAMLTDGTEVQGRRHARGFACWRQLYQRLWLVHGMLSVASGRTGRTFVT